MLKIGSKAPEFSLQNQDGIEISLKDLLGKWIVLYFYPKDNTPACTIQAKDFTNENFHFEQSDAIVLGISPDSPEKHADFIEKQDLSIVLLSDVEKNTSKDYGVWRLKKFMGKEYLGVVRTTFIIDPQGNIVAIWDKVNVRKKKKVKGEVVETLHVNEVREKLEQLQS